MLDLSASPPPAPPSLAPVLASLWLRLFRGPLPGLLDTDSAPNSTSKGGGDGGTGLPLGLPASRVVVHATLAALAQAKDVDALLTAVRLLRLAHDPSARANKPSLSPAEEELLDNVLLPAMDGDSYALVRAAASPCRACICTPVARTRHPCRCRLSALRLHAGMALST